MSLADLNPQTPAPDLLLVNRLTDAIVSFNRTGAMLYRSACPADDCIDALLASAIALAVRELALEHEHLPQLVMGLLQETR